MNICTSKLHSSHPLLYFRDLDILITTNGVVPLRRDSETLDIQGLLMLFIVSVQTYSCIQFHGDKLAQKCPKTGWAAALSKASDNYRNSIITLKKCGKDLSIKMMNTPCVTIQIEPEVCNICI